MTSVAAKMTSLFLIGAALARVYYAAAATTAEEVEKGLTKVGAQPWTHSLTTSCAVLSGDPPRSHPYPCQKTTTSMVPLHAGSLRIVKSEPITFETPVVTFLLNHLDSQTSGWQNCSSYTTSKQTESLRVTFKRNAVAVITDPVLYAGTTQLNFHWKVADGFTVSGNIQVGDRNTTASTDPNSYASAVSRDATATLLIPPQSAAALEFVTWTISYTTNFHTAITVDADLSSNDKYAHLSEVLTEADRTFHIAGTIYATDAAKGRGSLWEILFDATLCSGAREGADPIPVQIPPHPAPPSVPKAEWSYGDAKDLQPGRADK